MWICTLCFPWNPARSSKLLWHHSAKFKQGCSELWVNTSDSPSRTSFFSLSLVFINSQWVFSFTFSSFISRVINSLSCHTFPIISFSFFRQLSISVRCFFCLVTFLWRTVYLSYLIPITILYALYHLIACIKLIHILHIFVFILIFSLFAFFSYFLFSSYYIHYV